MTEGKKNLIRATIRVSRRLGQLNPHRDPSDGIVVEELEQYLSEWLTKILEMDEPRSD